ncbi:hypothetical protein ACQPW1_05825 [Nocardia sp. CA-128927]|uniref:hypothetical protein n=1 Tax=Nocardia sp. CA-128927 TaxID=3239975 RepID=UPI003D9801F6
MTSPWEGLSGQAKDGVLQLNPGVLEGLAGEVNNALGRVLAVRGQVNLVDNVKPFSKLGSSEALAQRFSDRGRELGKILDDHVEILNDMMDTFIAAGKHYKNTDTDSKVDFDKLQKSIVDKPGALTNKDRPGPKLSKELHSPEYRYGSMENGGMPKSALEPPNGVKFDGSKVHPEDPNPISYERYVEIHESMWKSETMADNPSASFVQAAQGAADWRWLASELNEKFDDLVNKMISVDNDWKSPNENGGAEKARAAVVAYGKHTDDLIANMGVIGDMLEYTSQWIWATAHDMGDWDEIYQKDGETPQQFEQRQHENIRQRAIMAMNDAYLPGLRNTDSKIAILPPAISPTTGQQPGEPGKTSTPGGPPGPPGPPGLNQQQLQANAEQQRKLKEQADQQRKDMEDQMQRVRQEQEQRAALQQKQEQQRATQQAAQQASQQATQMASQIGQQLSQAAQQMGQQLASAAQQAAQQAGLAGLPTLPTLPSMKDLEEQAKKALGTASSKGAGGPGPGSAAKPGGVGQNLDKASKLFPRAEAVTNAAATGARAGLASGAGMGMGPGPGPGAQGQQKEHKRADYLDSTEHLEDAIGDAPVVVKPVVEQ